MNRLIHVARRYSHSPRVVKVILWQQFLEGFVPITALYAIMFERVGGLNFEQISLLFALWTIAFLVFELPSGVLADYWSRRNVIILGGLLRALGFCVWLVQPDITGYAIGFVLWGASLTCSSGATTALLHTELNAINRGKQFAKYYGWSTSLYWLGALISYLVAAKLTLGHTNILILLSIGSSLMYAMLLLIVPEHPYKRQSTYVQTLLAGFREMAHSKKLRYVAYGLFSVYMIIGVLEELLPRIYLGFGLSETAVAIALAIALGLTVVVVARLEEFVRFSLSKQILIMTLGVALFIAGLYVGGLGGSALVLVFSLVFQLFRPIFSHHVQSEVRGNERSTIASIPGLFGGLLGAGAYVFISFVANHTNELTSIAIYSTGWLLILVWLAWAGRTYSTRGLTRTEYVE